MIDISIMDRRYTWPNLRENPCLAKLDRIMVPPEREERYPLASTRTCTRLTLDYVPLYLDTALDIPKRRFQFENMWL